MFANEDRSANVCTLVKLQASKAMKELEAKWLAHNERIKARGAFDPSMNRVLELEQEKDDLGSQIDIAHGRYRKVSVLLKRTIYAYPAWVVSNLMLPVLRSSEDVY